MRCLAATLARAVCVSLAIGAASAQAACLGPHNVEDMLAAGLTAPTIRAIFEETSWLACLSEEDLQRLRRAGFDEDLIAFLEERTAEPDEGAEYAAAYAEQEDAEPPPSLYPYPYPYDYYPYGYAYPYAYGGWFVGGGGFHHRYHHHEHVVAHDTLGPHGASHVGVVGLARPRVHGLAPSLGHLDSGWHQGGHGMHAGHGGHGGSGGHGGH